MSYPQNDSTEIPGRLVDNDTKVMDAVDLMTREMWLPIMRVLMFVVTPSISICGIVGNVFSIIILLKHGLQKCSNILLISLAVTDLGFLVAFNSVFKILYDVVGVESAWECSSRDVCFAIFILYNLVNLLDYGMGLTSLSMPMLITLERLVAVFMPFKFNSIITPTRTWCAVVCVYVYWYTMFIYTTFFFTFTYKYSAEYNITVGNMERSEFYFKNLRSAKTVEELMDYSCFKIAPLITLVGSVLIGVKVKMASNQRKKLTNASSKEASTNRTTKMLMAVCVVYLITSFVMALPSYFPHLMHWTMTNDAPTYFGRIMYQVINTCMCINSSANFVIYVLVNKNFRDTYKSLLVCSKSKM